MIGLRDYIKDPLRPDEDYGTAFLLFFLFFFSFFVAAIGDQPGVWRDSSDSSYSGEIRRIFILRNFKNIYRDVGYRGSLLFANSTMRGGLEISSKFKDAQTIKVTGYLLQTYMFNNKIGTRY